MKRALWIALALLAPILALRSEVVTLPLKSGSVIRGEITSVEGSKIKVTSEFGVVSLDLSQLTEEGAKAVAAASGDPSALRARIADLERLVAELKKDNDALRQRLAAAPRTPVAAPTAASALAPASATAPAASGLSHSMSSTGKRHNSRCRYFQSGRPCAPTDGVACKICGG